HATGASPTPPRPPNWRSSTIRAIGTPPDTTMPNWSAIYDRLQARIEALGVRVQARQLGFETTGIFDGLSITTNTDYDIETRCHNIAHSLGHIVQWSIDFPRFQSLYLELNAAK